MAATIADSGSTVGSWSRNKPDSPLETSGHRRRRRPRRRLGDDRFPPRRDIGEPVVGKKALRSLKGSDRSQKLLAINRFVERVSPIADDFLNSGGIEILDDIGIQITVVADIEGADRNGRCGKRQLCQNIQGKCRRKD